MRKIGKKEEIVRKKLVLFFLFGLCLVSTAFAQFGQTGSLNGTVIDPDGMPLQGVTVAIKSPAIILPEMVTMTNNQGSYRFPSLPPGTYEVTYTLQGMNTLVRKGIIISAGQTTTINVTLEPKKLEESVVVVGQSPTVDAQSTTRATNLDKSFIASIPAARNLDAFFGMTPGVIAESNPNGLMSSAFGGGVTDNAFNVDGVNVTAPDFGTLRIEIGMDIMEELSVLSGNLPAEYGDTMGTVVNVVTKSGGSTFSGSAGFYYNSDKLQSTNTKGTPLEGRLSGYKYVYEPSVSFGGPIVKERLWFFAHFGLNNRAINVAGFPFDKPETVPVVEKRIYPYFKFSFQPSQWNKCSFSYSFSNYVQEDGGATIAGYTFSQDATVKWTMPSHILNLQWTHFFTNNLFMDFKVGYTRGSDNLYPKHDQTVPLYIDVVSYQISGNWWTKRLYTRDRFQLNTNATYYKDNFFGSHEFKVGGEFQLTGAKGDDTPNKDPRNGMAQIITLGGFPILGTWFAETYERLATRNIFAFFQDTWRPVKRLTLNLGIRFSYQSNIIPAQNQNEGPQTFLGVTFNRSVTESYTPVKRTNLVPRLGLVYDLTGNGKTLFKASFSRYIQSNQISNFYAVNPNYQWGYSQLLNADCTPIPGAIIKVDYPNPAKIGYGDHSLRSPYTDEITVGVEREIFPDWSLALRYMKKGDRNLMQIVDANQLDIDKLMNEGELEWTNWEPVTFIDPYDKQQKMAWNQKHILAADLYLVNPPGAKRDYDGFEIILNKRFSQGWSLMVSYVYQNARGLIGNNYRNCFADYSYYENPNLQINAEGKMHLCRPHQFKLQAVVNGPWGVNISNFFRVLSGERYTRRIVTSDLGVFLNQGYETIYAESKGSRGLPTQIILDVRLEKVFPIEKCKIGLFVDCFNLFNNNKATQVQTVSSSSGVVFEEMMSIMDPRIFRLGAKFEF